MKLFGVKIEKNLKQLLRLFRMTGQRCEGCLFKALYLDNRRGIFDKKKRGVGYWVGSMVAYFL